mgnify:CR=1 FL=1
MRHGWKIVYMAMKGYRHNPHEMQYKHRICQNCGAEQMQDANYEWGRVKGYYWYPKIGRCKLPGKGEKRKNDAPNHGKIRRRLP